ncbi:uncharacterized protein [Nicotiana sylvestris]|uniref:uncharacterized protein n=1 Tax=Nicotiana sylvestris TaxID=4096 RepID=UPI00388C6F57
MQHVFIDFDLEEDHRNVKARSFLTICDMQMKLQKWTPNFKPEIKSTLAPVWINLPDLKWHYFEWDAFCRIVEPIGIPIIMDKATISKTRPTTAKIKIEIDVTKTLLHEVQIDIMNENGQMESIIQKVEYEAIPEYCSHCKMLGHSDLKCRILHLDLRQGVINAAKKVNESAKGKEKECTDVQGKGSNEIQVDGNKVAKSIVKTQGDASMDRDNSEQEEGWKTVINGKGGLQTLETTQARSKEYEEKSLVHERNPNNGTNLVDEYSYFESDSEVEVEETYLSNEIESKSDSEMPHLTNMNNCLGDNTGKVLSQDHQMVTDQNNLSPRGVNSGSTILPKMGLENIHHRPNSPEFQ